LLYQLSIAADGRAIGAGSGVFQADPGRQPKHARVGDQRPARRSFSVQQSGDRRVQLIGTVQNLVGGRDRFPAGTFDDLHQDPQPADGHEPGTDSPVAGLRFATGAEYVLVTLGARESWRTPRSAALIRGSEN
jgi:hypothetical protein